MDHCVFLSLSSHWPRAVFFILGTKAVALAKVNIGVFSLKEERLEFRASFVALRLHRAFFFFLVARSIFIPCQKSLLEDEGGDACYALEECSFHNLFIEKLFYEHNFMKGKGKYSIGKD